MDTLRLEYVEKSLANSNVPFVNSDSYPIAFYSALLLWSKEHNGIFSSFLEWALACRYLVFISLISLTIAVGVFLFFVRRIRLNTTLLVGMFGLGEMGFAVLLLLGFTSVLGYVYHRLGLLSAAFMFGTGLGAWSRSRRQGKELSRIRLRINAVLFAVLLIVYPFLLSLFASLQESAELFVEISFYSLAFLSGFLGGQSFPLGHAILACKDGDGSAKAAGLLYGSDLLGSSIGAIAASLVLLPLGGVAATTGIIAGGLLVLALVL